MTAVIFTPTNTLTATITPTYTHTPTVTLEVQNELITGFSNYPNPFSPPQGMTHITYTLSRDADVEIEIFNYLGDRLRKLKFRAGEEGGRGSPTGYQNMILWDGRDGKGILLGSGGCICRIIVKPQDGSLPDQKTRKIGIIRRR